MDAPRPRIEAKTVPLVKLGVAAHVGMYVCMFVYCNAPYCLLAVHYYYYVLCTTSTSNTT